MQKIGFVLVLLASIAHADRRIEIGGAIGGHAFSKTSELGVDDDMTLPGAASSVAFGARGGYLVLPFLAVEAEALAIPTKDTAPSKLGGGDGALALGIRAHARYDILRGRIVPFVLAGVGMHILAPSSPKMMGDADQSLHWGAGARYALDNTLELRIDARHLIVPDRTENGATSDFEITAGVTYRFDVGSPRVARVAAAPPMPAADRDLDTIPDATDKCPTKPEDIDSFEDDDGCPELDNDQDGIPDSDDVCPNDKETKNGDHDEDGCPDQVLGELPAIAFEQDSAKLDAAADPVLDRAAKLLTDFPGLSLEVAGHTAGEANAMDLSLKRAEAVKAALVKRGIPADRILTVGHGADRPLPDRRKSRRIEFRMLTPDEVL